MLMKDEPGDDDSQATQQFVDSPIYVKLIA